MTVLPSNSPTLPIQIEYGESQVRSGVQLGLLFCTLWAILGLYDTGFAAVIPGKAYVRYGLFFLFFFASLFAGSRARDRGYFRSVFSGFVLCFVIGLVSSVLGKSLPLGLMKLGLYTCLVWPLMRRGAVGELLNENGRAFKFLVLIGISFIIIALYRFRSANGIEIGNANHVSAMVLVAFPIIQLDQLNAKPVLGRQALRFALLAGVVAVVANHSRGAVAGVGVMVGSWLALRNGPSMARFLRTLVLGIVLLFLLATLSSGIEEYIYKGDETLVDDDRQSEFELFQDTFSERPWLGYGFGLSSRVEPEQLTYVLQTWRLSYFVGEFGNSSIAIITGGGILLFLTFTWLIFYLLQRTWQALCLEFSNFGASRLYCQTVVTFCAILGLLVHSQAEGWMMAPVTFAALSFWFYVSAAMHLSNEILAYDELLQAEVDTNED